MTSDQVVLACSVLGTIVLIYTTVQATRKSRRDAEKADLDERQALVARSFKDGRDSRNEEVRLLTSQRDDARHDRDEAQEDLRDLRSQIQSAQISQFGPRVNLARRPQPRDDGDR